MPEKILLFTASNTSRPDSGACYVVLQPDEQRQWILNFGKDQFLGLVGQPLSIACKDLYDSQAGLFANVYSWDLRIRRQDAGSKKLVRDAKIA